MLKLVKSRANQVSWLNLREMNTKPHRPRVQKTLVVRAIENMLLSTCYSPQDFMVQELHMLLSLGRQVLKALSGCEQVTKHFSAEPLPRHQHWC